MKAVIMAGGSGTRFWPYSRHATPKQLLPFHATLKQSAQHSRGATMLETTVERLLATNLIDDLSIVTRRDLYEQIRGLFSPDAVRHVIAEPQKKNTAPCIGLSAVYLSLEDPDAVMALFPSDHVIEMDHKFIESLKHAENIARNHNGIVTIGIAPTHPATGYGYIDCGDEVQSSQRGESQCKACLVRGFTEKPDQKRAEEFLKQESYLWNSGIFIWSISKFFEECERHMPELFLALMKIRERLVVGEEYDDIWDEIKDESIDYGLMERVEKAYVVKGEFSWSDMGSWKALHDFSEKDKDENVICGDGLIADGQRNLVYSHDGRLVTIVGLSDVVVVSTDDAILVCARDKTEDVKKIVDALKNGSRGEFL